MFRKLITPTERCLQFMFLEHPAINVLYLLVKTHLQEHIGVTMRETITAPKKKLAECCLTDPKNLAIAEF